MAASLAENNRGVYLHFKKGPKMKESSCRGWQNERGLSTCMYQEGAYKGRVAFSSCLEVGDSKIRDNKSEDLPASGADPQKDYAGVSIDTPA